MILPDKLDQLVVKCMKELHMLVEDDLKKDMSNIQLIYEIPDLYQSYVAANKKTDELNSIISKYMNESNLSLSQKKSFINLVNSFLK